MGMFRREATKTGVSPAAGGEELHNQVPCPQRSTMRNMASACDISFCQAQPCKRVSANSGKGSVGLGYSGWAQRLASAEQPATCYMACLRVPGKRYGTYDNPVAVFINSW